MQIPHIKQACHFQQKCFLEVSNNTFNYICVKLLLQSVWIEDFKQTKVIIGDVFVVELSVTFSDMITDMGWLCWSVFQMHPRDSISEHDDFSVRTVLYKNGICLFLLCYTFQMCYSVENKVLN